jgi:dienelactone hydrolase
MKKLLSFASLTTLLMLGCTAPAWAAQEPSDKTPAVKDLNTPRKFPPIASKAEWVTRAKEIREQALVSCGLWPMPEKTPLNARVFGKVEREGYSIEKVALETFPGFYLGGNLYRPLGKGKGPFPGVLNPHGHWRNGRMADEADGSIAARCISQARMGMVAFCYDMVGYNDTFFPNHGVVPVGQSYVRHRWFATNEVNLLWNISLMGLQTWNSIRALDFLESLPDVDRKRLACTGESGGGTQTFMLGAVDNRLAAQAPIVMVSSTMQGGCLCENAPGLRVEYSNMEIAASVAPRPQFLVAATGDWTKLTLTVEGPSIASIYRLFNAADKFGYVRYDFGHNYNKTSREAVYGFFAKQLLGCPGSEPIPEPAYKKEPDSDLLVFPDGKLPPNAQTEGELEHWLVAQYQAQLAAMAPHDKRSLSRYKEQMLPAWQHTLQAAWPTKAICSATESSSSDSGKTYILHSADGSRQVKVLTVQPSKSRGRAAIIASAGPHSDAQESLSGRLLERGFTVVNVDLGASPAARDPFSNFFYVYNRTALQERVQDVLLAAAFAREQLRATKILLCGQGSAGLVALLAAPAADFLVADCDGFDTEDTKALLTPDLFCPGLKKIGAFEGAALLVAPNPMLLHNTGEKFSTRMLRAAYDGSRAAKSLRVDREKLGGNEIVQWLEGVD